MTPTTALRFALLYALTLWHQFTLPHPLTPLACWHTYLDAARIAWWWST